MHIKIIPSANIHITSEYDNGTKLSFFLALIIATTHKINDIVHAMKNSSHKIFSIDYSSLSFFLFKIIASIVIHCRNSVILAISIATIKLFFRCRILVVLTFSAYFSQNGHSPFFLNSTSAKITHSICFLPFVRIFLISVFPIKIFVKQYIPTSFTSSSHYSQCFIKLIIATIYHCNNTFL